MLVGTDISGFWALLKDALGTAIKTGSMSKEGPPLKHSNARSVASDIALEEGIALTVPGTSTSPHSLTSTPVHPDNFLP